ncbi:MAG: carbohydrate ABC transporter permease [Aggregatilineales bacterium]
MVRPRYRQITEFISTHAILGAFALLFIFPIAYTFTTSFKSQLEVRTNPPLFFPQQWVMDGYQQVLHSDMLRFYVPNTFINSFGSSLLTVTLAGLAGYAFSRYKFRGSGALQIAILGLIMIPGLTNLVPIYKVASDLRRLLVNTSGILTLSEFTYSMMIGIYTAGGLPFTIWIVKTFFDTIPIELEEAALIDGCTPLQTLRHIVVPLARPGLVAAFLLMFVDTWNEFLAAVLLLNNNQLQTATVGLYTFQSSFEIAYHVWMAACILIMLPVVVLFLLLRRTFFSAMLQGALKG